MANSLLLSTLIMLAILALNLDLAASRRSLETCRASVQLKIKTGTNLCNTENVSNCCEPQKAYPQYRCSPPVKKNTHAIMTINGFTKHHQIGDPAIVNNNGKYYHIMEKDATVRHNTITSLDQIGDQKSPSKCGNKHYSDKELVVALSTGWYNRGSRCLKNIRIKGNGKTVVAKVVDECDSVNGCDSHNGFRVPCANNVVDASPAVWKALGISKSNFGSYMVTWSNV